MYFLTILTLTPKQLCDMEILQLLPIPYLDMEVLANWGHTR